MLRSVQHECQIHSAVDTSSLPEDVVRSIRGCDNPFLYIDREQNRITRSPSSVSYTPPGKNDASAGMANTRALRKGGESNPIGAFLSLYWLDLPLRPDLVNERLDKSRFVDLLSDH